MRRAPKLDLVPLLGALADPSVDDTTGRILDAAAEVLASGGLRRCTVEEIAERGHIGRTTIYRRFDGRDEIVHAVLARELRSFFDTVARSVEHLDRIEDQVVEGFLTALDAARDSPMLPLLRSEPDLLMFLVTDAGPVLDMVTGLMVAQLQSVASGTEIDSQRARHGAEIVFRLTVSFVLMPETTLPLDEPVAARESLHALFDPLLREVTLDHGATR
jgi:TetR/AcrR family transcriptional repressor of uid operon